MLQHVLVPMVQTSDGRQFRSELKAQLHEWRSNPVSVEPSSVRYEGGTYDGYGNLWSWACGRCQKAAPRNIDTLFRRYSCTCEHCNAENHFDFSKYGA